MIKNLLNSAKNLALCCIFIYAIIALFLGIQEANNMVMKVIQAF